MSMRQHFLAAILLLCAIASPASNAQVPFEYMPGAQYDPAVPTVESVLGHALGERITSHADMMKYIEALAASVPNRMQVHEYAQSWERRSLKYAIIASEKNMARLTEIRDGMQALSDPRVTGPKRAAELIESLPVPVWLSYGVHGNEISSPDAALLTAYHLLASRNDPVVDGILENAVIFINPTQNPDGRDRFVHNFEIAEGLVPDSSPISAEHNEPWPGGRTNHYYFDLNRDWFALTQPEIEGHVRVLQEWYPLVFVDLHEMGANSTYFFSPEAVPYNPHLDTDQIESLEIFGRGDAKWFDRFGFDYFTREIYDAFYPGYGASWPAYYGAVAMTYEQASARGLVVYRPGEPDLHFRDSVHHHFIASIATAETAAANREKLLGDFYRYRQTAIEEGANEGVREYILPLRGDTAAVVKLAGLLSIQGIDVKRAQAPFNACGETYPKGTYVVPSAQPAKRLIRNLLDVDVPMEEDFLAEQERRRKKKLGDEIYDVTAWSLPLMFNVECIPCSTESEGSFELVGPERVRAGNLLGDHGDVAFLAPWGTAAAGRLLTAALREDLKILSSDKAIQQGERSYPAGSLIFKTNENPSDLRQTLLRLAWDTGAEIFGTDTSWVDEGVNFGSRHVFRMRKPRIALAWDSPTSSNAAGATRYVLERQFGYPVSVIRSSQLGRSDLSRFQVLILPPSGFGGYAAVFGKGGAERIKDWVRAGGTLIAIGSAVAYVSSAEVGLLDVKLESLAKGKTEKKETTPKASDGAGNRTPGALIETEEEYLSAIGAKTEPPDALAGILAKALLDEDHWLTAGISKSLNVLVSGRNIFTPITIDKGVNAAYFAGPEDLLVSGYMWEENRKQLAYKPFVVVQNQGRGIVIGFTADPNFRAYMDGLNLIFLNAVFRGAAHARPAT